jgi:hypothetical protein
MAFDGATVTGFAAFQLASLKAFHVVGNDFGGGRGIFMRHEIFLS